MSPTKDLKIWGVMETATVFLIKININVTRWNALHQKKHGWEWELVAPNGKTLAISNCTYTSKNGCKRALKRVLDYLSTNPYYIEKDADNCYW